MSRGLSKLQLKAVRGKEGAEKGGGENVPGGAMNGQPTQGKRKRPQSGKDGIPGPGKTAESRDRPTPGGNIGTKEPDSTAETNGWRKDQESTVVEHAGPPSGNCLSGKTPPPPPPNGSELQLTAGRPQRTTSSPNDLSSANMATTSESDGRRHLQTGSPVGWWCRLPVFAASATETAEVSRQETTTMTTPTTNLRSILKHGNTVRPRASLSTPPRHHTAETRAANAAYEVVASPGGLSPMQSGNEQPLKPARTTTAAAAPSPSLRQSKIPRAEFFVLKSRSVSAAASFRSRSTERLGSRTFCPSFLLPSNDSRRNRSFARKEQHHTDPQQPPQQQQQQQGIEGEGSVATPLDCRPFSERPGNACEKSPPGSYNSRETANGGDRDRDRDKDRDARRESTLKSRRDAVNRRTWESGTDVVGAAAAAAAERNAADVRSRGGQAFEETESSPMVTESSSREKCRRIPPLNLSPLRLDADQDLICAAPDFSGTAINSNGSRHSVPETSELYDYDIILSRIKSSRMVDIITYAPPSPRCRPSVSQVNDEGGRQVYPTTPDQTQHYFSRLFSHLFGWLTRFRPAQQSSKEQTIADRTNRPSSAQAELPPPHRSESSSGDSSVRSDLLRSRASVSAEFSSASPRSSTASQQSAAAGARSRTTPSDSVDFLAYLTPTIPGRQASCPCNRVPLSPRHQRLNRSVSSTFSGSSPRRESATAAGVRSLQPPARRGSTTGSCDRMGGLPPPGSDDESWGSSSCSGGGGGGGRPTTSSSLMVLSGERLDRMQEMAVDAIDRMKQSECKTLQRRLLQTDTLLTSSLTKDFEETANMAPSPQRLARFKELLEELPVENSYVVEWLFTNSIVNESNARSFASLFGVDHKVLELLAQHRDMFFIRYF